MKKILISIFLLIIIPATLVACNSEHYSPVIISKYYSLEDFNNTAIELYNLSNEDVDLSEWKLDIYSNGDTIATYTNTLSGTIKSKGYYVIANAKTANEELKDKADLFAAELAYNGDDAIALKKNDEIVDVVGDLGYPTEFGKNVTLIKKPEHFKARTKYVPYDFMMYREGVFKYLKNEDFEIKTDKEMLDGPSLLEEYKDLPYEVVNGDNRFGGGGVVEVTLARNKDGDTADFKAVSGKPFWDSSLNANKGGYSDTIPVRYTMIDTRENSPSSVGVQEWGQPASEFMKNLLNNAKKIEIQSVINKALTDGYGRHLAFVWVDGVLANFLVVRAGLSDSRSADLGREALQLHYKDVAYVGFMENAEYRAIKNKWCLHGEKDPMWNYNSNSPLAAASPYLPDMREYKEGEIV